MLIEVGYQGLVLLDILKHYEKGSMSLLLHRMQSNDREIINLVRVVEAQIQALQDLHYGRGSAEEILMKMRQELISCVGLTQEQVDRIERYIFKSAKGSDKR